MSISGIGQSDQLSRINGISFLDQYDQDAKTTSQVSGSKKDSSQISQMGQWMSQLANLSTTDSDAFKQLAQQISEELSQQAQSAASVGQSTMLSGLSQQFSQAASTGSMESLKPKGPPPQGAGGKDGGGMDQVESIISQSLSSLSNASTGSSDTASWEGGGMGGLMKQLGALQKSDPEAFKKVTEEISEKLAAQAGTSTSGSSGLLSELSSKFAEAAQSGSMESLKPEGPPPPPPGGFQEGDSGSGSGTSTQASSNQELFAMLQSMMGSQSTSLTDAGSWTTFLSAMKAYGSSA